MRFYQKGTCFALAALFPILMAVIFILEKRTAYGQQTIIDLEGDIFYLPKDILQTYINRNSAVANYWTRNRLTQKNFRYFIWKSDGIAFIPHDCDMLSTTEARKFKEIFDSWSKNQNDTFLITAREMMLYRLNLIKWGYGSAIDKIDKLLHNEHRKSDIKFYLSQFSSSQGLKFDYSTFNSSELHDSREWIDLDADFLNSRLRLIKKNPDGFPIKISIQGFWKDQPIGNFKISLHHSIMEYPMGDAPLTMDRVRINYDQFLGLNKIQQLRCNRIHLERNSTESFFYTSAYDDMLQKSTIERPAGSDTIFVLTYFKTSNFDPVDSKGNNLTAQFNRMAEFLPAFWGNYHETRPQSQDGWKLYLEFTGYADKTGRNESIDVWQEDYTWLDLNNKLSRARAQSVQKRFLENLQNSGITIAASTVQGCDKSYYLEDDRSVEIKAWIQ